MIVNLSDQIGIMLDSGRWSTRSTAKGSYALAVARVQNWLLGRAKHPVYYAADGIASQAFLHHDGDTRAYFTATTNTKYIGIRVFAEEAPAQGVSTITITPDNGGGTPVSRNFSIDGAYTLRPIMRQFVVPINSTGAQYAKIEWTNAHIIGIVIYEMPRAKLDSDATDTISNPIGSGHAGLDAGRHITDSTTSGPRSLVAGAENAKGAIKRSYTLLNTDDTEAVSYLISTASAWEGIGTGVWGFSSSWKGWELDPLAFRTGETSIVYTAHIRAKKTTGGTSTAYLRLYDSTTTDTAQVTLSTSWTWFSTTFSIGAGLTTYIKPEAYSTSSGDSVEIAAVELVP